MTELLEITGLSVDFRQRGLRRARFRAVDDVHLRIGEGETLGLVGESGSGKSTIGKAILGLVPIAAGRIEFNGEDLSRAIRRDRRAVAADVQVVFQDPFSSLSPVRTIRDSVGEPLSTQPGTPRSTVVPVVEAMLAKVGLGPEAMRRYPFEFSGGQRQRIAIARALTVGPRLVICDESVSALDVSTQAQVLNLLRDLQTRSRMSYLFIAHNLDVVRYISDRIVVLYRGRVMEEGPAEEVHGRPRHPYTRALLAASPVADPAAQSRRRAARLTATRVTTAGAEVPPPEACPFAPRCPYVADVCWTTRPAMSAADGVQAACHLYDPASGHPRGGLGIQE